MKSNRILDDISPVNVQSFSLTGNAPARPAHIAHPDRAGTLLQLSVLLLRGHPIDSRHLRELNKLVTVETEQQLTLILPGGELLERIPQRFSALERAIALRSALADACDLETAELLLGLPKLERRNFPVSRENMRGSREQRGEVATYHCLGEMVACSPARAMHISALGIQELDP